MGVLIAILAVFVLAAVYFVSLYNGLVRLREAVKQAWSNIGVLLKQRHDEIPKLVETCRQYMTYEQETLERVLHARADVAQAESTGNMRDLASAESGLRTGLGRLYAVAEQYPSLKANEGFQQLQARITGLEEQIADRRELYNAAVNLYNARQEIFPDSIIAGCGDFHPAHLLEFSAEDQQDPSVKALFGTDPPHAPAT
ncbi:MAG TPA: LemA family protein [Steroidobacteraceae bacterium]|jgi:LemA protein|nr:LemA family protein [Steroidobacteraceae bacterium]